MSENILLGWESFKIQEGKFEGEIVDGHMNGYGKLFDHLDQLLYEGEFKNGSMNGSGTVFN